MQLKFQPDSSLSFLLTKQLVSGSTSSIPASPLFLALLGTAGILATGICLILAALCRRHFSSRDKRRTCHRPTDNGSKHVPMEAIIEADDLIVDGCVTGVRTSMTPTSQDQLMMVEPTMQIGAIDAGDPDIIRNQYGNDHLLYLYYVNLKEHVCGSRILY